MNRLQLPCANRRVRLPALLLALVLAGGCSDSSDPVQEDPPETAPVVGAGLSRTTGAGDGSQIQDAFELWIDDDFLGDATALRLAGYTDDAGEAGEPGETVFQIAPAPGAALFAPGVDRQADLLAADGSVRASVLFLGPAAVTIISPTSDDQLSLDGFELIWQSDGEGAVTLRLTSEVDQTTWSIETTNSGSRTITAQNLAGMPKGPCLIEVIRERSGTLTSVQLGAGPIEFLLTGRVVAGLGS